MKKQIETKDNVNCIQSDSDLYVTILCKRRIGSDVFDGFYYVWIEQMAEMWKNELHFFRAPIQPLCKYLFQCV